MSLTFTDGFCGAGGSSIGLEAAGLELVIAANHWERAIETHSANFPNADHLCADLSNYDMRRLPHTDVAWFSPECTWHSPAGGRRRKRAQLDLFDEYVPDAAGDRSRMTMVDVIRATEAHRYLAVVVENVIEVAAWELFDWWLDGMSRLGYRCQIVCVSSAHIGSKTNVPAPQWRDRLYMVFNREDVPVPDVAPRPPAWCPTCDEVIEASQAWKKVGRRIGKYGQQYVYVHGRCSTVVEPFVLPAAAAIDWSDLGQRIGDRPRPLAAATMRRIRVGLEMFAQPLTVATGGGTFERESSGYARAWPLLDAPLRTRTGTTGDAVVLNVNHHGDDGRPYPSGSAPLAPRTSRIGDGLAFPPFQVDCYDYSGGDERRVRPITNPMSSVVANGRHHSVVMPEPFITMLRGNNRPADVNDPLATLTTGRHHYLTVPGSFLSKHHGGLDYGPIEHMNKSADDAMPTVVGKPNISLVIPYRRTNRCRTTAEPLNAISTVESAALCSVEIDVDDCHFRMLKPREHLRGQRFPDDYEVKGNQGEQTMQAGNAVSSNVSQWLGGAIVEALS